MKHFIAVLFLTLSSFAFAVDKVDINTADAVTIAASLKGIGEAKAAAIVEHRKSHGAFKSADDLVLVKGIGEKTVEANRDLIVVGKTSQ